MRHFVGFIIMVFAAMSAVYYYNKEGVSGIEDKKIHVYASSSFVAKWGPGPALKELFEKQNIFKVEFVEISDMSAAIQKISFENESSLADVVLGMDQFDLVRVANKIHWRDIDRATTTALVGPVRPVAAEPAYVPYDWAPLTFVARKEIPVTLTSLADALRPEFKGKIALQDPRTSSPGLQFLAWIFETKPPDEALRYLKSVMKQAHSFSPSWSGSYGLFTNHQADLVFSYVTSPVYHRIEDGDLNYFSVETAEPLPVQVEFAGIPATCKNCEAAEMFVNFLLTPEAQKILMTKNYMLPVVDHAKEGTAFDAIKIYKTLPVRLYDPARIEKWIGTWSELRKNEGL